MPAVVVRGLRCNGGLRFLSGFLTLFMAFLLRDEPFPGWEDRPELLLGLVIGSAGLGNTVGIALGNVLGSGLFNTLAVVGLAGTIAPMDVESAALTRDLPVMAGLTVLLWKMGRGWRRPGRINRWEAGGLLGVYGAYTLWLLWTMGPR